MSIMVYTSDMLKAALSFVGISGNSKKTHRLFFKTIINLLEMVRSFLQND
jgi:hypothetical protein